MNLGIAGKRALVCAASAGLAREVAAHGVTINNLLPGSFDTDRLRTTLAAQAQRANRSIDAQRDVRAGMIPARRLGDPAEFGALCAFVCGMGARYITGQNLLIDGGAYPGTF